MTKQEALDLLEKLIADIEDDYTCELPDEREALKVLSAKPASWDVLTQRLDAIGKVNPVEALVVDTIKPKFNYSNHEECRPEGLDNAGFVKYINEQQQHRVKKAMKTIRKHLPND